MSTNDLHSFNIVLLKHVSSAAKIPNWK